MERKYQMIKELADALQNRIQEENLPIKIEFGEEEVPGCMQTGLRFRISIF